jgi:hypothetical protein
MYERIIAAALRYSAVMNYAGAVEIPLLPRQPSVVLELPLDSGFAADACHPCRRLLGSDDTAAATSSRARTPTCSGRLFLPAQVLSVDLIFN